MKRVALTDVETGDGQSARTHNDVDSEVLFEDDAWNDFFIRGSFFECRQLCLNSHGVLEVRTGHESVNQSQPCWALPHQARGSNTEARSSAHKQDVSTLTGT